MMTKNKHIITGHKKVKVDTMMLVLNSFTRTRGRDEDFRGAPVGGLIGFGEYRYYAGYHYDGESKTTRGYGVGSDTPWSFILEEVLEKFPDVESEGRPLGYGDWKLKIVCPTRPCIDLIWKVLESEDEEVELSGLRAFNSVSCGLTPQDKIDESLISNKHVRDEY